MGMRRLGLMTAITASLALVAGACGAPSGDGDLRALPSGGSGGGAAVRAEAGAMLADDAAASWYRPVIYEAGDGLGGTPDKAPAYELTGKVDEADVDRLARALGLEGDVSGDDRLFRLEDGDVTLQVIRRPGGGAWMVTNSGGLDEITTACAVAIAPEPGDGDGDSASKHESGDAPVQERMLSEECPEPEPVPGLLSAAEAKKRAQAIVEALGISGVELSFDAQEPAGASTAVMVTATIDGHPIQGMDNWFSFGPHGAVLSAGGWLGRFDSIGDYPLVDAATAVDRLNRGPDVSSGIGVPEPGVAESGEAVSGTTESHAGESTPAERAVEPAPGTEPGQYPDPSSVPECPPEADCVGPEPGPLEGPLPEPEPEIVVLEQVRVGYRVVSGWCDDDPVLLVPAFVFDVPGGFGGELSVDAVTDDLLQDRDGGADHRIDCGGTESEQVPARDPDPRESRVATTTQ